MTKIIAGLQVLAGALFYLGIGMFLLGHMITFIPGSQDSWFTTAAVLLAFGLVIPRWHRVVAICFLIACGFEIQEGHREGLRYRQRVEEARAKRSALVPPSD